MPDSITSINGTTTLICAADGDPLRTERDAVDLIGEALQHGATLVAIPAERLDDELFDLRTRLFGEFAQKFVNYRLRLAILGDIAHYVEQSTALRDFVYETNRGSQIWFVANPDELGEKLGPAGSDE